MSVDRTTTAARFEGTLRWTRIARSRAVATAAVVAAFVVLAASPPSPAYWSAPLALLLVSALLRAPRRAPQRTVTVRDGLVHWRDDTRTEGARADVRAGWRTPTAFGDRVTLRFANGDALDLEGATPDEARALLDAAGVGARHAVMRFSTRASWMRSAWFLLTFVMGTSAIAFAMLTLVAFVIYPFLGVLTLVPLAATALLTAAMVRRIDAQDVDVGLDGVSVRGDRTTRFLSYAMVESATCVEGAAVLTLRSGETVRIDDARLGGPTVTALVARVNDALAAWREAHGHTTVADKLRREGQPFEAWRAELQRIATADAVYRTHALDREELRAVLDDVAAPPVARVAAALALDAHRDAADLTRVRIAAEGTAHDPLRVALERVLDGTLDERTLVRLERAALPRD